MKYNMGTTSQDPRVAGFDCDINLALISKSGDWNDKGRAQTDYFGVIYWILYITQMKFFASNITWITANSRRNSWAKWADLLNNRFRYSSSSSGAVSDGGRSREFPGQG